MYIVEASPSTRKLRWVSSDHAIPRFYGLGVTKTSSMCSATALKTFSVIYNWTGSEKRSVFPTVQVTESTPLPRLPTPATATQARGLNLIRTG